MINSFFVMVFFTAFFEPAYAQDQEIDEFLEWPTTDNYNFVLIAIVILIAIGIMANYLWSTRKGRKYSEE